jgi:hypothetical protein
VEEVLTARIDRLPEGAKSLLQLGAVIGREFGWELLREVSGLPEREFATYLTPSLMPNSSTRAGYRRRRYTCSSTPSRRRRPTAVC